MDNQGPTQPKYVDLRGKLPRNAANAKKWLRTRPLSQIRYWYVHFTDQHITAWATQLDEIAQLKGIANYHINKDWSSDHSGVYGWTAMYTWAIGPTGTVYILNDLADILWNTNYGNTHGAATVLLLGEGQMPTPAQITGLQQHLDYQTWIGRGKGITASHRSTFGHGECAHVWGEGPDFGNSTNCPSAPVVDWVRKYREGNIVPTPTPGPQPPHEDNRFFPETGQYISHGFKEYWESEPKALEYFGYPITSEMEETLSDGKPHVVQYFERARFEWHPDAPVGEAVRLGLLGAEHEAHKQGAAHDSTSC